MHKGKLALSILALLFGIFMIVYGEYDDSPGGQLLGLLVVIASVWGALKSRKKTK